MKVMLVAGEASGDMYSAYLAKEIKKKNPDCELFGMGGIRMENEGVKVIFPISLDIIGILDFLLSIPKGFILLNKVCGFIKETKPDIVVLIDSAEFNLHLLQKIKRMNIKIAWLFPPTAWAWRRNRAKIVSKYVSLVLSTLPFERDFYKAYGAQVCFIGHPLLDIVKTNGKLEILDRKRVTISLLPGSRKQEIRRNLPIMINSAKLLSSFIPELQFFIILAPGIEKSFVEPFISGFNIKMVSHSYDAMAQSDILITSSGTATLEGTILGKPMVVVYKMDRLSWFLAKHLVKMKFASLPNIISNKMVVPELLGDNAKDELIAKEAISILNNKEKREDMQKSLLSVKDTLGPSGAMEEAAEAIIRL
ncbi:TPA: lipid-A-disaccharide synthase [bacterium]|nr:lipid-A-disaccharide synthase [bacterium]